MESLTDKVIRKLIDIASDKELDPMYKKGMVDAINSIKLHEMNAEFEEVAMVLSNHLSNVKKYYPEDTAIIKSSGVELFSLKLIFK